MPRYRRRAATPAPVATAEPGCVDAHPCYQPFVFTLDALLPIVDLGQDDAWRVNGDAGRLGPALLVAWWVYVIAGWTLTTAVIAGAGALLRRE